jgi:hypothetical protein
MLGYIKAQQTLAISYKRILKLKVANFLLVNWQTSEEHTISFRESAGYQQWSALLHRFYELFPEV